MKNLKKLMIYSLASLALGACGESNPPSESVAKASPNIIFIITDDQGWTSVSYPSDPSRSDTASDYIETPNMAALAAEGMRFSQAYTPNPEQLRDQWQSYLCGCRN